MSVILNAQCARCSALSKPDKFTAFTVDGREAA